MSHGGGDYEKTDAKAMPLVWCAVVTAILVIASFVVCVGLFKAMDGYWAKSDLTVHPMVKADQRPSNAPILQIEESKDLKAWKQKESERLNGYGWVDEQGGVAHIPIDDAIDLVLKKKGLQSR